MSDPNDRDVVETDGNFTFYTDPDCDPVQVDGESDEEFDDRCSQDND